MQQQQQQSVGSQQQQQQTSVGNPPHIKEVWAATLESEMAAIRDLVEEYPFVSMVRLVNPLVTSAYSLTQIKRTLNSRELLPAQSALSKTPTTTTTKPFAATSTC